MLPGAIVDPPSSLPTVGVLLRQLRLRAGLSQRDFAIAVGYSESQISRLEHGQRLPDPDVIRARFLIALGLDHDSEPAHQLLQLATLARDGLPSEPPPAPAAPLAANTLPTPLTSLINRVEELDTLAELLARPSVRLLTLTGPPGIGKTRLCIQVASEAQALFADGVFFVSLASVHLPDLVLPTIARAIGIEAERHLEEALYAALRERCSLLVLDNFEQVVAAAPQVAALLRSAPQVKALVSSRTPLHVSGEYRYAVPPLDLPDLATLPSLEILARYPGIALFVERVCALVPGFNLNAENAATVAEICVRLHGLPLAIELAAARSKLFSPQALLERLRGSIFSPALSLLVRGPRDLPAHQQTLRSTIAWSYWLLAEAERALFVRLGVFVGGCTAEAAASISDDPAVENLLESLADHSLLQLESAREGTTRFVVLEMIREYAWEQAATSGVLEEARQRHAHYFATLAHSAEAGLAGAEQERWLAQIEGDYGNLWAALQWFCQHEPVAGLRSATALKRFWLLRGHVGEGRSWLERLLGAVVASDDTNAVRAAALSLAGTLAYNQGDHIYANACSHESLMIYRAFGNQLGIAASLLNLGRVAFNQGAYAEAMGCYEEGLAIYRVLNDKAGVAQALKNMALVAKDQGDFVRANQLHEENLALCKPSNDRQFVANILVNMSIVAYWEGVYGRAESLARQAAASYRELSDWMGLGYATESLGMVAYKQGRCAEALQTLEEALALFRSLDERIGMAMTLQDMGVVACACGDLVRATQLQREALTLAWQIGDRRRVAFCLEGLAAAAVQPLAAVRLLASAEVLREALGTPLPPSERADYTQLVANLRVACDAQLFAAALQAGRALPLAQLVDELLAQAVDR